MDLKLKVRIFVSLFLLFFTMFAIFNFSAQNGNESNGLSSIFSRLFCKLLFSGFDEMTSEQQLFVVSGINHFVRKAAHFTAYAVLGFCSYTSVYLIGIRLKGVYLPAVMLCAAYAVLDEIHQYFTPGRSIKITDMLLDTVGGAFGALAAMVVGIVIVHIKTQLKRKKYKPEEVS